MVSWVWSFRIYFRMRWFLFFLELYVKSSSYKYEINDKWFIFVNLKPIIMWTDFLFFAILNSVLYMGKKIFLVIILVSKILRYIRIQIQKTKKSSFQVTLHMMYTAYIFNIFNMSSVLAQKLDFVKNNGNKKLPNQLQSQTLNRNSLWLLKMLILYFLIAIRNYIYLLYM